MKAFLLTEHEGIQSALGLLSLVILALRIWVRINLRGQKLLLSDHLILLGWLPALAVVVCNAVTLQMISVAGEDALVNGYQLQISEHQLKVCTAKVTSYC